jgi:N-acetylmuramoyl-L-alanine amidase
VELAKEYPDAIFISIHMNTLPIEKYKGLQVFFSNNDPRSKILANTIQKDTKGLLQSDNNRESKDAKGSIYLLDRIGGCAVLVECGFLSNREEASLLRDGEYQKKLAFVLSRSILSFTQESNKLE